MILTIRNHSNDKRTEFNGRKPNTYLRFGLEDHFIANFPKPDTLDKKFYWNTKNNNTRV